MAKIVERIFDIIEALADEKEISLTELAKKLYLPKGTTCRLLMSLKTRGYVDQNPITRRYRLGVRIVSLGRKVLGNVDLRIESRVVLENLLRETKESIHLAILQSGEVVFVDSLPSLHSLRVHKLPGERGAVHCTAVGKVLLAYAALPKVNEIIKQKGLPQLTPNTITSASDLKKRLDRIRRQGFAIDNEESNEGCRCIAAPIRDHTDRVVAALSITGPSTRITPERFNQLVELVKRAADKISAHLGFSPQMTSK